MAQERPWWHEELPDEGGENPADVSAIAQDVASAAAAVTRWAQSNGLAESVKFLAGQSAESVRVFASMAQTAAADRLKSRESETPPSPPRAAPVTDHSTCASCPVCQGIEMVRDADPDTAQSLEDGLAAITETLLRSLATWGESTRSGSGVEKIVVDD